MRRERAAMDPSARVRILSHWQAVNASTGQLFNFQDALPEGFVYDTEPACRDVVVMSQLQEISQVLLAFFSGIQQRFYVDGADPKQPAFYQALCAEAGVSYADFLKVFQSPEAKIATTQEFQRCRSWGIRGFPSIVLEVNGRVTHLASGYTTATALIEKIESTLSNSSISS